MSTNTHPHNALSSKVRVLAKGSGELTAAVWAESADVARLAGNLGYDCDALLAEVSVACG